MAPDFFERLDSLINARHQLAQHEFLPQAGRDQQLVERADLHNLDQPMVPRPKKRKPSK